MALLPSEELIHSYNMALVPRE